MFIPKWVIISVGLYMALVNYTEAKHGLAAIVHDLTR